MLLESISSFIYILFMCAGSLNERGEMTWASVQRLQRGGGGGGSRANSVNVIISEIPSNGSGGRGELQKSRSLQLHEQLSPAPWAHPACTPPHRLPAARSRLPATCCKILHVAPPGGGRGAKRPLRLSSRASKQICMLAAVLACALLAIPPRLRATGFSGGGGLSVGLVSTICLCYSSMSRVFLAFWRVFSDFPRFSCLRLADL